MSSLPPEYLEWAQKITVAEHVSLRSFVVRFDLSDRESATKAYCELIKSIYIRRKRRQALKTSFDHFRTHYEDRFWTKRALEVRTELVANRSGLIVHEIGEVQSKVAFNKFIRAHSGLENEPPDEEEELPKLKKASSVCEVTGWSTEGENELQDQDRRHRGDDEESVEQGSVEEEGTRLPGRGRYLENLTNPLANKRVDEELVSEKSNKSPRKRTLTSETGTGTSKRHHARSAVFHLDVNGLVRIPYKVDGVDVGDGFYQLQRSGVVLVNMKNLLATTNNFAYLLIWDTSEDVPDIPAATIQHVKNHLTQDIVEFGDEKSLLLCALEQELARGSVCHHQYSDQTDALLCHIFQALRRELPQTYFAFELGGEDTFIHNIVHTLFVLVFEDYDIEWANVQSVGSKERRSERDLEGLRPDLTISKAGVTVLSLECKPPTYDRRSVVYLKDKWKLANLGKDEVDRQLKLNIDLPFHVVIQVFGHCMEVSSITLEHGVYHFHCQQKVYLPRARDDIGAVRNSIRALLSVKNWFDAFRFPPRYEEAGMRTPPAKAKQRKKTLISPTQRDLFNVRREP